MIRRERQRFRRLSLWRKLSGIRSSVGFLKLLFGAVLLSLVGWVFVSLAKLGSSCHCTAGECHCAAEEQVVLSDPFIPEPTILDFGAAKKSREEKTTTTTKKKKAEERQADLTIIVLTMNRLKSLQRLMKSLLAADYGDHVIDLVVQVDRPSERGNRPAVLAKYLEEWKQTVAWVKSGAIKWTFGAFKVQVADQNWGLRQAWLNAWTPRNDHDRALVLEDDTEVSQFFYTWLRGAYEAYGHRADIAGFSLQRQKFVPVVDATKKQYKVPETEKEPFLYRLVGSIGYAPRAPVWRAFLEWTSFALADRNPLQLPALKTSAWYRDMDQRMMWTQHFIYFTNHYHLYTLYCFPPNRRALAAHWREAGAHSGGDIGADFPPVTDPPTPFGYPTALKKYNWNAQLETDRTLVLGNAMGCSTERLRQFVQNLRAVYAGDIHLYLTADTFESNKDLLEQEKVKVTLGSQTGDLALFQWFQSTCTTSQYWLCLASKVATTTFQYHPFSNLELEVRSLDLALFPRLTPLSSMTSRRRGGGGSKCKLPRPERWKNQTLSQTGAQLPMVDGGALVGKPHAFTELAVLVERYPSCSIHEILSVAVYADLFTKTVKARIYAWGYGTILHYGADSLDSLHRDDKDRIMTREHLVVPVLQRYPP